MADTTSQVPPPAALTPRRRLRCAANQPLCSGLVSPCPIRGLFGVGVQMRLEPSVMRRVALGLALGPVCLLGAMAATPAGARENYALIITASDYPNLPEKYWLKGPKNDAELVRDYLLNAAPVKFEPANVVTLGSGEGLQLATHQTILDQLADLAQKARAGDFIYIQFSGHGSQQPATVDANEPDGRDEVFLAADTMMATKDNPSFLPNVLTDDEMSGALKAIRKTGASVFLIFDSCHSGSMTRGAPEDQGLTMRDIDPGDLGIPDSAFASATSEGDAGLAQRAAPISADVYADGSDTEGPLVAFFAAQSNETTPEKPYDVTAADGAEARLNYGVFTHTIFSALAKNPNMTYRQLAQSVLAGYTADNLTKPTPMFEGKLDQPVFGSGDAVDVAQWPTVIGQDGSITISAGQLHGLAKGTRLLLIPGPAVDNDTAIGVMEVTSNDQLRSTLQPASDATHPLIETSAIPAGAYVRLAEVSYPFELRVARPDPATTDPAQLAEIDAALAGILSDPNTAMKMTVVPAGKDADVRLAVYSYRAAGTLDGEPERAAAIAARSASAAGDGDAEAALDEPRLWLLPPTGELSLRPQNESAAMPLTEGPTLTQDLSKNLTAIFRATGLSRLTQASTFKPRDIALTFSVQRAGSDALEELAPEATPIVRPDDMLFVKFSNSSGKPADLNVLYVDHDYGISVLCQAQLANGETLFQPFARLNETDRGAERIVAVVNESGREVTDLSFLSQPGIHRTRGSDTGLLGAIADLGAGQPTRGPTGLATRDSKQPRGAVTMVPLEVLEAGPAAEDVPLAEAPPLTGTCTIPGG